MRYVYGSVGDVRIGCRLLNLWLVLYNYLVMISADHIDETVCAKKREELLVLGRFGRG